MRHSCVLFFGVLIASFALPAHAAEDWRIEKFESAVVVLKDNTILVTESLTVFFASPKHGIVRDIPTYEVDLDILGVANEAGQGLPYQLEWSVGWGTGERYTYRRIRIGDPKIEVQGRHVYVIRYRIAWALGFLEDYDELYWNVTGDKWPVPIAQVVSGVTLPEDLSPDQLKTRCLTGSAGSTTENCSINIMDSKTIRYEAMGLELNEGLTVVAGFPKGLVKEPTSVERLLRQLRICITLATIPLLTLLRMLVLWVRPVAILGRSAASRLSGIPQRT